MNIVELGCTCGTLWFFNLPSAKNSFSASYTPLSVKICFLLWKFQITIFKILPGQFFILITVILFGGSVLCFSYYSRKLWRAWPLICLYILAVVPRFFLLFWYFFRFTSFFVLVVVCQGFWDQGLIIDSHAPEMVRVRICWRKLIKEYQTQNEQRFKWS